MGRCGAKRCINNGVAGAHRCGGLFDVGGWADGGAGGRTDCRTGEWVDVWLGEAQNELEFGGKLEAPCHQAAFYRSICHLIFYVRGPASESQNCLALCIWGSQQL